MMQMDNQEAFAYAPVTWPPRQSWQKELCRMHDTGEYPISDLAELFRVSRPTVYRTLARGSAR